jgi:hypothetical protein
MQLDIHDHFNLCGNELFHNSKFHYTNIILMRNCTLLCNYIQLCNFLWLRWCYMFDYNSCWLQFTYILCNCIILANPTSLVHIRPSSPHMAHRSTFLCGADQCRHQIIWIMCARSGHSSVRLQRTSDKSHMVHLKVIVNGYIDQGRALCVNLCNISVVCSSHFLLPIPDGYKLKVMCTTFTMLPRGILSRMWLLCLPPVFHICVANGSASSARVT